MLDLNLFNKGAEAFNHGLYEEALSIFELCRAESAGDLGCELAYGFALTNIGHFVDALKILLPLHELNQDAASYILECIVGCSVDDLDFCRSLFEKIVDNNPNDYVATKGLSILNYRPDRHPDPVLADRLGLYCPPNGGRWWLPSLTNPADIVCAAMMAGREFEPYVAAAAARILRPGDWVIDGGANFGQLAVGMARLVGPSGRVIAVEADPFVARALEANAAENSVDWISVAQVALWNQAGETVFFPPWDPIETPSLGSRMLDPAAESGETPIQTQTIDQLLADYAPDRPLALLKLDVQGAELRALEGAAETLRRWAPPVIIELDEACMQRFGYQSADLMGCLAALGHTHAVQLDAVNWLVQRPR